MAKQAKIRGIERELEEHFSALCLDNRPERLRVARWIARREASPVLAARAAAPRGPIHATERGPPVLAEPAAGVTLHAVPVYEVRLVEAREPLMLASRKADYSGSAAQALHGLIAMTDREHLACLFVNGSHEITGVHVAAIGAQHRIGTVDTRVIFRAALAACASAVVLGHNHPSGDATPSPEDIEATAGVMRAGNAIGIPVVDHVIVTRDRSRYFSMMDRGRMPNVAP